MARQPPENDPIIEEGEDEEMPEDGEIQEDDDDLADYDEEEVMRDLPDFAKEDRERFDPNWRQEDVDAGGMRAYEMMVDMMNLEDSNLDTDPDRGPSAPGGPPGGLPGGQPPLGPVRIPGRRLIGVFPRFWVRNEEHTRGIQTSSSVTGIDLSERARSPQPPDVPPGEYTDADRTEFFERNLKKTREFDILVIPTWRAAATTDTQRTNEQAYISNVNTTEKAMRRSLYLEKDVVEPYPRSHWFLSIGDFFHKWAIFYPHKDSYWEQKDIMFAKRNLIRQPIDRCDHCHNEFWMFHNDPVNWDTAHSEDLAYSIPIRITDNVQRWLRTEGKELEPNEKDRTIAPSVWCFQCVLLSM
jgi:hypothetical protein